MKSLQMLFATDMGKNYTFVINQPKDNLSKEEVMTAMEQIISNKYLSVPAGVPQMIKSAKIVDKVETTLFEIE